MSKWKHDYISVCCHCVGSKACEIEDIYNFVDITEELRCPLKSQISQLVRECTKLQYCYIKIPRIVPRKEEYKKVTEKHANAIRFRDDDDEEDYTMMLSTNHLFMRRSFQVLTFQLRREELRNLKGAKSEF